MTFKDLVNKAAKLLDTETPEQKRQKVEHLAGILNAYNQIMDDMVWQEGNLPPAPEMFGRSPALDYLTALRDIIPTHLTTFNVGVNMGEPPHPGFSSHFGMVRELRKQFKQYSKEEFRELSKEPVVKHILTGTTKLTKEEIADRIKEHLDNIE